MVIASLPNVKNAGINPEELDVNSAIFKHVISVYEKEDGNVTMNIWSEDVLDSNILTANIYIWRIPEEAYQLFWVARIYYATGSETGYSDNIINKSMSEVALDNYDQATPEQKEKLDEFMKNYTVTWFDDKGAEIKTDYNQKYGETLSVPSAAYKAGYDAVWYKRTGTDVDDNPVWSDTPYDVTAEDSLVRSDTQLKAGYEVKTYTLTYNGLSDAPGGAESASNPATYNVESSTITINNPTHANNYFLGWTFEGQTTPVKNPTIPTGSIGDKTFTANWGDFTKPDDDFVYMGYYGLLTPKSVSGYGVLASDVVYTSSNTSIATVSGHRINAVATGTVTITAKLGNSTYGYRTQTFSVTVKATSEGDGETSARTLDTDLAMHNNNKAALAVANYSGDLTLFVGDSFMDGRNFFTDFYERFATKSAHLLGIGGSRASEWRFLIQDYFAYAPKNIVLHIGTNDLFGGQMSVAATFGYVKNVLEVIRYGAPSAKVYFWSIEDRYTVSGWSKNKNAEITELNDEINAYAIKNSAWLTFVDTRSLLTSASDYKETSGTTIHPSIPTGYDKCIQATFDAGLNLTENVYASTNIVKDWTSVNGTDNFSSAKVMGMQARVSEFVWESDVTIRNFSNGGAKGHITINWRTPTEVGGKTDGQNNRFVILNKSSGIDKGQFHFVGNTPSANAWGTTGADYFYATSGAATTFKLAILVTDTDAYLFYNDILVAVYMNVGLGAATTYTDASYNAFRVGGELATVDFRNNKISNPHLNSSVYEAYLNRDDVARCDADTSVTSQEIVMRATTFNVYNNFYFNPNGISVSFTDKSVTPNKTFTGIVENNKVTVKAESAGEFIGNHIYDVTSEISGLNFKLYSNASVKKLPNTVIAGGSIIEFDIFSAGWNTIKTKTTNGQYNIHLGIGKYSKRLATYNSSDFYSKMSFDLTKLATALPSSFYVAAFIVGNVENNTGGMRFGFNMETSERDYSTTLMQNSGQNNPSIQELNSWAGWGNFSRTTLRNNGYWFVVHYDSANRQKTVY
ncbi:MAG: hypothetical protein J6Y43_05370, partial [Clostridia bacterium]|nr:hypothetical protein [Clostridia bacterium]